MRPNPAANMRPFHSADWTFIDPDVEASTLARIEVSSTYVIRQLNDGRVIIVTFPPMRPLPGEPTSYVVGEPMNFGDALRHLADISDSL